VDAPRFEHDTRDKDPDGRTGGDAGLDVFDGHIWRMFREHLILDLEGKPIAVAWPQSTIVLQEHPQEGDPRPVLFDPLNLHDFTLRGRGPIVRIHHECQVLPTCEGFREAESTPPRRDIDHLPNSESCLIRGDHTKIHNRSHRPPEVHPLYVEILLGQHEYRSLHGEFLLHSVHPLTHE
jgi:hypothetical protein